MLVDAHVHIWDISGGPFGVRYPWLSADLPAICRTFTLHDIRRNMDAAGVGSLVLVQASDSLAETDALVAAARADDRPVRVVGWLPLDDPAATERAIRVYSGEPLAGVRHLIHDEPDPRWLLRPGVDASLGLLAEAGLTFDAVAERPDLLALVPEIARRHPDLTIVVDHLGKPAIARGDWQPWADLLADAASLPNVVAKISGLNTVSARSWASDDWLPYVKHASDVFGAERLMFGGDWPFCLQNGEYDDVLAASLSVIDRTFHARSAEVLSLNARRIYG